MLCALLLKTPTPSCPKSIHEIFMFLILLLLPLVRVFPLWRPVGHVWTLIAVSRLEYIVGIIQTLALDCIVVQGAMNELQVH